MLPRMFFFPSRRNLDKQRSLRDRFTSLVPQRFPHYNIGAVWQGEYKIHNKIGCQRSEVDSKAA